MRSGYIYGYSGTLRYAGLNGHEWTDMALSEVTNSYAIYFYELKVNPSSNYYYRYFALPVRYKYKYIDASYDERSGIQA